MFSFFCYFVVVVVGKEGAGARELLLILWFANIVVIVLFAAAMIDGANCCGCFFWDIFGYITQYLIIAKPPLFYP